MSVTCVEVRYLAHVYGLSSIMYQPTHPKRMKIGLLHISIKRILLRRLHNCFSYYTAMFRQLTLYDLLLFLYEHVDNFISSTSKIAYPQLSHNLLPWGLQYTSPPNNSLVRIKRIHLKLAQTSKIHRTLTTIHGLLPAIFDR